MNRVLVTGAGGFIGRPALSLLVQRGYEVHAVSTQGVEEDSAGARWHRADLLDPNAANALVASVRPTHLLHLAWYTEPGGFWTSSENLRWLGASVRLVQEFAAGGGRRAVIAGTCAEYDWRFGVLSEVDTPLAPNTLYGASKHALRAVVAALAAESGFGYAWGRVFFLFGPGEHPAKLVASVARALLRGEPAPCSHGKQVRDFLHVHDVASAFVRLLDSEATGPVNVGSGEPVSVGQLVSIIGELTGRPELLRFGEVSSCPGEPPVILADTGRLRQELGWKPTFSLEAGLADTVAWWRAEL